MAELLFRGVDWDPAGGNVNKALVAELAERSVVYRDVVDSILAGSEFVLLCQTCSSLSQKPSTHGLLLSHKYFLNQFSKLTQARFSNGF